jgi:AcrR family transcriptional regulator
MGGGLTDDRRGQILRAALAVVVERGMPETRIADVAARAGVSPALVIYYFKTKDRLLTEALRLAEDKWYAEGARRMKELPSAAERLEMVVAMTCLPEEDDELEESWVLWLDLWAAAARQPEVRSVREEFDGRWRDTVRAIVKEGQDASEFLPIDVEDFSVGFCSFLDGLAIQIALEDPVVTPEHAFELSMKLAASQLGFSWDGKGAPARQGRAGRAPNAGFRG